MLRCRLLLTFLAFALPAFCINASEQNPRIYAAQVIHADDKTSRERKLAEFSFQETAITAHVLQSKPKLRWITTTLYQQVGDIDVRYAVVLPESDDALLVSDESINKWRIASTPVMAAVNKGKPNEYELDGRQFRTTRTVLSNCDNSSADYPLRIIETIKIGQQSFELANGYTDDIDSTIHPESGKAISCATFKNYYQNRKLFANVEWVADLNGDHFPVFLASSTQKYCHEIRLYLSQADGNSWQPSLVASDDVCSD